MPRNEHWGSDRFQEIKQLMNEAKYDEALNIIELFSSKDDVGEEELLSVNLLACHILIQKRNFQEGLELAESILKESQRLGASLIEIDACIIKAEALENLVKYDESLKVIQQGETLIKTKTELLPLMVEYRRASLLYLKGRNQWRKGDLDPSMDNLKKSLTIGRKSNNKKVVALSLRNIGLIYHNKGILDQALEYYQQSLIQSDEISFFEGKVFAQNNIGWIKLGKGDLDQALECFQQSLTLCGEINYKPGIAYSHQGIAFVYRSNIELDKTITHLHKELSIYEELGDLNQIARTINYIGAIHYYKGDLKLALECHSQSFEMFTQIGDEQSKAQALAGFGDVYRCRGELDQALSYYRKSLDICEALNAQNAIPYRYSLRYMGKIYYEKNEINNALKHLQKALDIAEKTSDYADISYLCFLLILAYLEINQTEEIENLLEKSHKTTNDRTAEYRFISAVDKLSNATVLKNSKRIASRSKAQQIFEEIVEEGSDFEIWLIAMLFLCDLLLEELQAFGDTGIIDEIEELVQKMDGIARKQRSLSILIELDILRAKLAFILGSSVKAFELLEKAQEIASEKGMELLVQKALAQKDAIKNKFDEWEEFLRQNTSLKERIDKVELQEYLVDALALAKAGSHEEH
ncbi:MAG: tetratricopeptide repeat protein [Candidatus Hodarchaeota archaeon]